MNLGCLCFHYPHHTSVWGWMCGCFHTKHETFLPGRVLIFLLLPLPCLRWVVVVVGFYFVVGFSFVTWFTNRYWTRLPPLLWIGGVAPELKCESLYEATLTMVENARLDCDSDSPETKTKRNYMACGGYWRPRPGIKGIQFVKLLEMFLPDRFSLLL